MYHFYLDFFVTLHIRSKSKTVPVERIDTELFIAKRISRHNIADRSNIMLRIASLSVSISIAVMIISLAVIFGFKREITSRLTGFGAQIEITNMDGNSSFEMRPISKSHPLIKYLDSVSNIRSASPFAIKAGIINGTDAIGGIVLKGVDSTYDWTFFKDNMVKGELPRIGGPSRNKDVIISETLAKEMNLDVGDAADMLFIQDPPRKDRFRIRGIYNTHYDELDKIMVMTDIRNVQRLNHWHPDEVSGIEVTLHDFSRLYDTAEEIDTTNFAITEHDPVNTPLAITDIRTKNPVIFDWLDAHNINAGIIITIMIIVALFNMITALLIILLEKTSMIGILKTLGMTNRSLQKIFLLRASRIILGGMLWGNVIGITICLIQHYTGIIPLDSSGYFLNVVPVYLNWDWLLIMNITVFILVTGLLSLPTMIISLILPEKTIKYE